MKLVVLSLIFIEYHPLILLKIWAVTKIYRTNSPNFFSKRVDSFKKRSLHHRIL